jgi:hypothetical protein
MTLEVVMSKTGAAVSVREIKAAIRSLPTRKKSSLLLWLAEMEEKEWDEQIRRDAGKGKLQALLDEVDGDIARGKLQRMP